MFCKMPPEKPWIVLSHAVDGLGSELSQRNPTASCAVNNTLRVSLTACVNAATALSCTEPPGIHRPHPTLRDGMGIVLKRSHTKRGSTHYARIVVPGLDVTLPSPISILCKCYNIGLHVFHASHIYQASGYKIVYSY